MAVAGVSAGSPSAAPRVRFERPGATIGLGQGAPGLVLISLARLCVALTLLITLGAPVASGTTYHPVDLKTCVEAADVIFAGTVTRMVAVEDSGSIVTRVTFSDVLHVRGKPDSGEVVLKVLGGQVGDRGLLDESGPKFGKGLRYVILATADLGSGRNIFTPIVYYNQGLFTVGPDRASGREVVHTAAGSPLVAFRKGHVVVLGPYRKRGTPLAAIRLTPGADASQSAPPDSSWADKPIMGSNGRVAFEMVDRSRDPGTRFSEEQFLALLREMSKSR